MKSAEAERRERLHRYQGRSEVIGELVLRLGRQIAGARMDMPETPRTDAEALDALETLAAYNSRLQAGILDLLKWLTDQQSEIADEMALLAVEFRDEAEGERLGP